MIIGGIDPGRKGGLTLLEDGKVIEALHVPSINAKGVKSKANFPLMAHEWTPALRRCDHVAIEMVGAMPKQGVASMFNFGYIAGFAYGLVAGLEIPHTFYLPRVWKREVGICGDDKSLSFKRVFQLFPESADRFKRVTVDEGIAEAALMAYALYQKLKSPAPMEPEEW
jgi:crossover junction endodeoxyribonuclease RuvC